MALLMTFVITCDTVPEYGKMMSHKYVETMENNPRSG
jgi:hypothetical protein